MITSLTNNKVKSVNKMLVSSKVRRLDSSFFIEGVRLFSEAPEDRIIEVYYTDQGLERLKTQFPGSYEIAVRKQEAGRAFKITDEVAAKMCDTEHPQGISALIRKKDYCLDDIIDDNPFILAIEDISDPGNLGTMIRTAEGAGVSGIVLSRNSVDLYNPKVVRSTMGSIFRVPVYVPDDFCGALSQLKAKETPGGTIRIVGTHLGGSEFYDNDLRGPLCFLIGNEGRGLSDEASKAADTLVRIPMCGKVESLNAAISASVVSYEVLRQRRSE